MIHDGMGGCFDMDILINTWVYRQTYWLKLGEFIEVA